MMLLMMDSKQSSKYCVNEMVPLGTSKEALIYVHETMLQTENQPADPDFIPVNLSRKSSRKTAAILIVISVIVIIVVFGGTFVTKNYAAKRKEKENGNRK